jgi:hypothetical protein
VVAVFVDSVVRIACAVPINADGADGDDTVDRGGIVQRRIPDSVRTVASRRHDHNSCISRIRQGHAHGVAYLLRPGDAQVDDVGAALKGVFDAIR